MPDTIAAAIARRADAAGLSVSPATLGGLEKYLAVLARWNRRINLTALPLDPPTDEAIDRLVVEPLIAAGQILDDDRVVIDIGSGGGSPAIPLKIAVPRLNLVLVESKRRKAAFLREAVRQLELRDVEVENERVEALAAQPRFQRSADVVTLRAVRANGEVWDAALTLTKCGGRIFWFTTMGANWGDRPNIEAVFQLVPGVVTGTELVIIRNEGWQLDP